MPDEVIAPYIERYGGNPFIYWTDSQVGGYRPDDPGRDVAKMKESVQDYVSSRDFKFLEESQEWWSSTPQEVHPNLGEATVSFLSTGAIPNSQGKHDGTTTKTILKVMAGAIERIPKELKHLDTSQQVSKHKFPQDRWAKHPGCWVHVHSRPRKSMLIPTGTKNGPNVPDCGS